jgi:hypothetical protein
MRVKFPKTHWKIDLKCTILHVQVLCLPILTNHYIMLPHRYTWKCYLWIKLIIIIMMMMIIINNNNNNNNTPPVRLSCILHHFTQTVFIYFTLNIYVCKRDTCNLLMCLDRRWQRSCLFNKYVHHIMALRVDCKLTQLIWAATVHNEYIYIYIYTSSLQYFSRSERNSYEK